MEPTVQAASRADIVAALANSECRAVLEELSTRPHSPTSLHALADDARGYDSNGIAATPLLLHHVTLPKLDAVGLVEYDHVEQTVQYQPNECAESVVDTVGKEAR